MKQLLLLVPLLAGNWLQQGDQLLAKRHYQEAIQAYETHLKDHPREGKARLGLAISFRETGDRSRALREAITAVSLDPQNPRFHLELGKCQIAVGQTAKARSAFKKALSLDPKLAEAQTWLNKLRSR